MRGHRNFSEVADTAVANLRCKIGGFRGIMMIMVRDRDPGGAHHPLVDRGTEEAVEAVRHSLCGSPGFTLRSGKGPARQRACPKHRQKEAEPSSHQRANR